MKIFISYASEDEKKVTPIVDGLKQINGIELFFYPELPCGKDQRKFMRENIQKCDVCLIFATPNYKVKADKSGSGLKYEVSRMREYINTGNEKFIPVLLEGSFSESLPPFLATKKGIDVNKRSLQQSVNDILRILNIDNGQKDFSDYFFQITKLAILECTHFLLSKFK